MTPSKSWQKLVWQDPFLLNQQLTDEQRMVRDSAAQYAQSRLAPRVREAFRAEHTDKGFPGDGRDGPVGGDHRRLRLPRC